MTTLASSFFLSSLLFLQVTRTTLTSQLDSKYGKIRPETEELALREGLKKSQYTYNGRNVVTTLVPSFLNESSSFL